MSCSAIRLSVIVPGCNNPEKWWRRCVASVLAACGSEDEVVCVDDGSKTPVEPGWVFADSDARVSLYRKGNGGLSSARNYGMGKVCGRYIAFVDSDDEVSPESFDHCIRHIEATKSDICVYGVKTIWVDEGLYKIDVAENKSYGALRPIDVRELLRKRLLNYAWNKVYCRGFLVSNNLKFDVDGMPCEDIIFNLQCIMAGAKWCSLDYVGYVYYRAGMTLLSAYKPSNIKGLIASSNTWRDYKQSSHEAGKMLGKFGEISETELEKAEWANMWKPKSPFTMMERYKWLKDKGRHIQGRFLLLEMARALASVFARRCLYFRPVRRWNIKRQYPSAVEWKRGVH